MQVFKAVVSFFNKITKDTQEVSLWRRDMVPQNIIRVLLAGVFFFIQPFAMHYLRVIKFRQELLSLINLIQIP